MELKAILCDTRSIQKYVFYSNKLITNIGASYIVSHIFEEAMTNAFKELELKATTNWQEEKDTLLIPDGTVCEAKIVYIGGGNMLVLVCTEEGKCYELCKNIVQKFTRYILLNAPGLKTGVVIGDFDADDNPNNVETSRAKASLDNLRKQLKFNQNNVFPEVELPYTGLTYECDLSGKVADTEREGKRVSSEVEAKYKNYERADKELKKIVSDVTDAELTFPTLLEEIGFKKGESYICVSHIDGNNMGMKFSSCKTVQAYKNLSLDVKAKVDKAVKELVAYIQDRHEELFWDDDELKLKKRFNSDASDYYRRR